MGLLTDVFLSAKIIRESTVIGEKGMSGSEAVSNAAQPAHRSVGGAIGIEQRAANSAMLLKVYAVIPRITS